MLKVNLENLMEHTFIIRFLYDYDPSISYNSNPYTRYLSHVILDGEFKILECRGNLINQIYDLYKKNEEAYNGTSYLKLTYNSNIGQFNIEIKKDISLESINEGVDNFIKNYPLTDYLVNSDMLEQRYNRINLIKEVLC